jgi:hypothetical protein
MKAEAIRLVPRHAAAGSDQALDDTVLCARAHRIVSLLAAIDAGELLSELPACPVAQSNHLAAVDLLAIAAEEARLLMTELDQRDAE